MANTGVELRIREDGKVYVGDYAVGIVKRYEERNSNKLIGFMVDNLIEEIEQKIPKRITFFDLVQAVTTILEYHNDATEIMTTITEEIFAEPDNDLGADEDEEEDDIEPERSLYMCDTCGKCHHSSAKSKSPMARPTSIEEIMKMSDILIEYSFQVNEMRLVKNRAVLSEYEGQEISEERLYHLLRSNANVAVIGSYEGKGTLIASNFMAIAPTESVRG